MKVPILLLAFYLAIVSAIVAPNSPTAGALPPDINTQDNEKDWCGALGASSPCRSEAPSFRDSKMLLLVLGVLTGTMLVEGGTGRRY